MNVKAKNSKLVCHLDFGFDLEFEL